MKIFTKSVLVTVAMMAVATTVSAQSWKDDSEHWVDLTAEDWHQWKADPDALGFEACNKSAVMVMDPDDPEKPATAAIIDRMNQDVGAGQGVFGAENIEHNIFADISDYDYLIIFGSCSTTGNPGPGVRVMCNRIHKEGAWKQVNTNFFPSWVDEYSGATVINEYYDEDYGCLAIPVEIFKTKTVEQNSPNPAEEARQAEIDAGIVSGAERVDDFVHLHCLKNAWGGAFPVNISAFMVWKAQDDPTGIKDLMASVKDGAYYNLAGQKVANPEKGVFIHNGKKIVKK